MHGDRDSDAGVAARQLLERDDVGDEVGSCPAELLRDADPHQPELAEPREQRARERPLAIPGRRMRLDLAGDDVADELTESRLLVG